MSLNKRFNSYFNVSTVDIPFLYFLYICSVPLAMLFVKFKLKPNTITTFSNISAIVSFYFIVVDYNFLYFFFFWILALFLDISDGMVARATDKKSANGSFYDHFTDQVKIILLFFSTAIYFDTKEIWILTFLTSTLFLLYAYISYMLKFRRSILEKCKIKKNEQVKNQNKASFMRKYTYNNIFLMQGNFVVYLSFIVLTTINVYVFYILLFIIIFNLLNTVRHMIKTNNELMNNDLKWN
jgi:phosphatidylglycerophosphate synthase